MAASASGQRDDRGLRSGGATAGGGPGDGGTGVATGRGKFPDAGRRPACAGPGAGGTIGDTGDAGDAGDSGSWTTGSGGTTAGASTSWVSSPIAITIRRSLSAGGGGVASSQGRSPSASV